MAARIFFRKRGFALRDHAIHLKNHLEQDYRQALDQAWIIPFLRLYTPADFMKIREQVAVRKAIAVFGKIGIDHVFA